MASTTKSTKLELESARVEIIELTAELELERKMRKKMESLAKKMAKELAEERRIREEAERLCDELGIRVSHQKAEIEKMEREMDEERRTLRVAEVIREERVQMKLEDAKNFYEEKLISLEQNDQCSKAIKERKRWVSEPENPHIKRGIKGFVEFPRGVRSVGSSNKSNRNYKLECQKAQLRILLKQRSPIQPSSLVIS